MNPLTIPEQPLSVNIIHEVKQIEPLPYNTINPLHLPEPEYSLLLKLRTLTFREKEILCLVAKGITSSEIANALFISKHTVDTHRRRVIKKMEFRCYLDWKNAADVFS